ncbi:hypothetical protein [Yinghuangia sp. ASG 101]|uniref:hypothetical protein n=1 Tax=Yinghuangia sp. ASG 101 TaxID=2896848 RepID=UPI003FCC5CBD
MARDYDSQLLESVAVRRRRLRDALLFGSQRIRRSLEEGLGRVFGGIALATVLCAGCVGWSFVAEQRSKKDDKPPTPQPTSPLVPAPPGAVAPTPAGSDAWVPATALPPSFAPGTDLAPTQAPATAPPAPALGVNAQ